jgi:predicted ATPase/DNA-binding CsgD family transcriptional regulator
MESLSVSSQPRRPSRHNLVEPLTSFVGREREVADVGRMLGETRLLTLFGAGGVGKTRLARRTGLQVLPSYRDGVWLVELAPLADPTTIPRAVASALGIQEEPGRDLTETLAGAVQARQVLLILDNCEHLLDGVAGLVTRLLGACPDLSILTTSREILGVAGESIHRVPSLAVPDDASLRGERGDVAAALAHHDATRLFVERAHSVQDGFQVTEQNAASIAQICRRLDGIALAIELAAARARLLTPQQIAARLDDRFRLLTNGGRAALPRQRTLRAAIDWSYDLLTEPERVFLQRLAVFAGGCTLEAAEAVTAAGPDSLDVLGRLVDRSLVTVDLSGAEARYGLLETIREYALEKLDASGEAEAVRRWHANHFLALAERTEPALHGPDQAAWLDRFELEHENFRSALSWTLGEGDAPMIALRLTRALGWFWFIRSPLSEARWLEMALTATDGPTTDIECIRARAKAFFWLGWIARFRNDPPRAFALGEKSLALSRAIGDRPAEAFTLAIMGTLLRDLGDYPRARAAAERGIVLARETGEQRATAHGLYALASIIFYERYVAPYAGPDGSCPVPFPSWSLLDLPQATLDQLPITLLEESLAISRQLGDLWGMAVALTGGGGLTAYSIVAGDFARATSACRESLDLHWRIHGVRSVGLALRGFGHIALGQGEPARAARLLAAFRRQYELSGALLGHSVWPGDEPEMVALRAHLQVPAEAFTAIWQQGRAMSLEQAIAYALRETDPFGDDETTASTPGAAGPSAVRDVAALTPREREVAVLVGRGYSNRRIAAHLVIAEKTAEVHARNIREKLGLESRAQIAAWVAQRGLLPDS